MKYLLLLFCTFTFNLFADVDHFTHWKAKDYHFNSDEQFQVAKHIVSHIPIKGDEAVLDIGCGDGKITAMIQDRLKNGHAVGVDISPDMVAYATKMFPQVTFLQKDAHSINYDNEFDIIVSFTAMQWVTDQMAALKAIHTSLKTDGKLIVEMPQGLPLQMQQAVDKVICMPNYSDYFTDYNPNWRFYECEEYQAILEKSQFKVNSIRSREVTHTFQTAQAFKGFISQWFPYLTQVPQEEKEDFLTQVFDEYMD